MKKTNLDEMQEQKLLQIEHTCCWLAFWGLVTAMVAQVAIGGSLRDIAGEAAVVFLLCGYLAFQTIRNGIWDRHIKPGLKNNLLGSLVAAAIIGIVNFFRFRGHITDPERLAATCIISMAVVFAACFVTLSVSAALQKKQREKLDRE